MSNTTLTSWILNNASDTNGTLRIANQLGGDGAPKLKFLFSVEFAFRKDFGVDKGSSKLEIIRYDLKTASRPSVSVNQEDVNFYNYRTKVATKTTFGAVKLTFYEDSLNTANDLLWKYLRNVSPITNYTGDPSIDSGGEETTGILADGGISTIGDLVHTDGLIKWMKVNHHYVKYGGDKPEERKTTYTCANPKVETIESDELDMAGGDASLVSVTFSIDSVRVEHNSVIHQSTEPLPNKVLTA